MYIFECVYGLHNMNASNSIRKIFSFISNDFATNIFSQSRLFCCQLSFQEFVRPSSSSSYPVSRFSSPEPTLQDLSSSSPPPVSVSEGVSCSTPRTSRWSLTAKDFNTLYCTHGNKSLCSLIKNEFLLIEMKCQQFILAT